MIPALDDLLACVCLELETTGAGPVCWCGLWPGEVSLEYCEGCDSGACGMAWVRVSQAFNSDAFPLPVTSCAGTLVVQVSVGVVRCMPVAEADGSLPSVEVIGETHDRVMKDMLAVRKAIMCCDLPDVALGEWASVGPMGGCVGGLWTAYVGLE